MSVRFRVCFFKVEPDLRLVIAMIIISVLLILKFANITLCLGWSWFVKGLSSVYVPTLVVSPLFYQRGICFMLLPSNLFFVILNVSLVEVGSVELFYFFLIKSQSFLSF